MSQNEAEVNSAIKKRDFELSFISPMVMHGLDNRNQAEFRMSSLKGIFRYWWRTLQLDIENGELLKEEEKLFGGTATKHKRKSPIQLILSQPVTESSKVNILPHKKFTPGTAIKENKTVIVTIQVLKENFMFLTYEKYFHYMFHLAGMGQRARRGFGACQIREHKWNHVDEFKQSLYDSLEALNQTNVFSWNLSSSCVLKRNGDVMSPHPTLYAVYIGKGKKSVQEVLNDIGTASHFGNPRGSLGTIRPKREASPLWCTIRKIGSEYYPIITELRTNKKMEHSSSYERDKKAFLEHLGVK